MTPGERLATSLDTLPGIGAGLARQLAAAGIATIGDLLWSLPYRWEDRFAPRAIGEIGGLEPVTIVGRLVAVAERRARTRRMRILEALVDDGTGALPVVWFNQPYLASTLREGMRVWLHGVVRSGRGRGWELNAPEWEIEDADSDPIHLGRVVPIYRRVGAVSGRRLRSFVARALERVGDLPDPLLPLLPAGLDLPPVGQALREAHFPAVPEGIDRMAMLDALLERTTPALRRLALEELVALAVVLERERARRRSQRAVACTVSDETRARARAALPFRLTAAQRRVVAEIVADLQQPWPMARLLQGDVGSGKTIVAALAALVMLASGGQVALLAPTELLAQQHHATLTRLLGAAAAAPDLLIGSMRAAEKRAVRDRLSTREPRLVVGTHALLEDQVALPSLGLAIIDEQHRFGVSQRQALLAKGGSPHLLVMTATPIPRSLALSLYGDLDVSVLDEMPPGRSPVRTVLRDDPARSRLLQFLRDEVASGGRIYWVFPLIEESEKVSRRAVETHAGAVREALPGIPVGIVHGRMKAEEREATMASFAAGEVQVLCATTVIEVGVDVPEASVMVIENAETFGLAQLHQLRGRVGRGARRSMCVLLLGAEPPPDAVRRLELFASTNDGFRIAEEDFRVRGPGELTGLRQSGRPELVVARLDRHRRELEIARDLAACAASDGRLPDLAEAVSRPGLVGREVGAG